MSNEPNNNNGNALETAKFLLSTLTIVWAVKFISDIFGKDKGQEERQDKANRASEEIYKKFPPSFTDNQYFDWANTLDNAILGGIDEDEVTVAEIFSKFKNASDLIKTNEFFGTRRMQRTMQYVTLGEAISHYFSPSEKKVLNTILKNKKINYSF